MDDELQVDWTHLPNGVEEVSLWRCLHDGFLLACESDEETRNVRLTFRVKHLVEDDEVTFFFYIKEVSSARASLVFRPRRPFEENSNTSPEERTLLVEKYQRKFQERSVAWSEFESFLPTDNMDISDAGVAMKEGAVTLRLEGFMDGENINDLYCTIFVRGVELSVSRSDQDTFSLSDFIALGNEYWETL